MAASTALANSTSAPSPMVGWSADELTALRTNVEVFTEAAPRMPGVKHWVAYVPLGVLTALLGRPWKLKHPGTGEVLQRWDLDDSAVTRGASTGKMVVRKMLAGRR